MADLRPELFAADVHRAVRVLSEPPVELGALEVLARRARRVLFLGMGSSRFAALDAATLLRAHGVEATFVVAGGSLPGAALEIDLPGADAPFVRRLVETLVAELVAAELWARAPA